MSKLKVLTNDDLSKISDDFGEILENEVSKSISVKELEDLDLDIVISYDNEQLDVDVDVGVLFDELSAHYHLGGSDTEYKDLQGSAFLLWEGAKVAHEMGLECLHLGGGLSLSPEDKLFAFKKGFSNIINEF